MRPRVVSASGGGGRMGLVAEGGLLRGGDGVRVEVRVDDDGPGILPDRRAQVLRAFEIGQDGGTGLGLTIARDIIRAHGGEMALEQAPEGGLRVRLYLPN